MDFLVVGVGGFIGAIARYFIYIQEQTFSPYKFPLATLLINLLGCFLAGVFFIIYLSLANTPANIALLMV